MRPAGLRMLGAVVPVLVTAAAEVAARRGVFPETLFPAPSQIWRTGLDLVQSGELLAHLATSALRVMLGFLLGAGAGLLVGGAMGLDRRVERVVGSTLHAVRQVSLFAWMPVIIVLFGIGEASKVVFIAVGAFFPMVLNTYQGARNVPASLVEVGRVFEYSRIALLWKIVVPAALPSLLTGVRLSLGFAWMLVVGAELFGADSGVGFLMTWGRQMFQTDVVFVGVLTVGTTGFLMNLALRRMERHVLRWRSVSDAR